MKLWLIHARLTAETCTGEIEAETGEAAIETAKRTAEIKLCRKCSHVYQDVQLDNFLAEEVVSEGEGPGDYYAEPETWRELARFAGWVPPWQEQARAAGWLPPANEPATEEGDAVNKRATKKRGKAAETKESR